MTVERSTGLSPHDMTLRQLRAMQERADEVFFLRDHMRPDPPRQLQPRRGRNAGGDKSKGNIFAAAPMISRSVVMVPQGK